LPEYPFALALRVVVRRIKEVDAADVSLAGRVVAISACACSSTLHTLTSTTGDGNFAFGLAPKEMASAVVVVGPIFGVQRLLIQLLLNGAHYHSTASV